MRAIVLESLGGSDKLLTSELPDPEPGYGEVVVRVRAEGVCGRDLIDRRGGHKGMKLPIVLGHEFAGEVTRVGPGVGALVPGDRVVNLLRVSCGACRACRGGDTTLCQERWESYGQARDGGYAEMVSAPEASLVKIPGDIDWAEAAPVACTAGVALHALRTVAQLSLGETLLVTGASGGVGTAAIQVAHAMGARVVAATTQDHKAARLVELGADEVVVSSEDGLEQSVRSAVPLGVDVALELTGRPTFGASMRSLRPGGRLVLIGNIPAEHVDFNPGAVILFGYRILGSAACTRTDLEDALELVRHGDLRIVIDRVLPLERASEAHDALARREVTGRIVLLP
jgi:acryloyl-coenzyme A reductase